MLQKTFIIISSLVLLASCSHSDKKEGPAESQGETLTAKIQPKSGNKTLRGAVKIVEKEDHLVLAAKIIGLEPGSTHGFHIHEKGDCSAKDAKSAGGHFSPAGNKHGSYEDSSRHAGDLGNIEANDKGVALVKRKLVGLNMKDDDDYSVKNRAVVVHEQPDDLSSQPSGAAGPRIGCGVIK